jgi:hypothetical protein
MHSHPNLTPLAGLYLLESSIENRFKMQRLGLIMPYSQETLRVIDNHHPGGDAK